MSHRDRVKAILASSQQQEATKAAGYGYGIGGFNGFSRGNDPINNPIIKVVGDRMESRDPRVKLESYRVFAHALPIVQAAIRAHKAFIGTPKIYAGEKGNPKAVAILEKFWEDTPIHGQYINDIAADRGLASFTDQMVTSVFTDGSQFFKLVQEVVEGKVNKSPIEGIRLFDSALFDYMQDTSDIEKLVLQYCSPNNGTIDITAKMGFQEMHFEAKPRFPWGLPITYGMEFIAERFIRQLVSYVNGTIRTGDPIGITMIGYKAPDRTGMTDAKIHADKVKNAMETAEGLRSAHSDAIKKQRFTNNPQDIVATLEAESISMNTNYYGAGIPLPTNFSKDSEWLAKSFAHSLNTPFMFLGLDQGGGGLGSSLFQNQKALFVMACDRERELLEKNCINRINKAVLVANSITVTPDTYSYEWEQADMSDEKLEAETKKLEAEAVAQQLLNITTINTELSGIGSNKVALVDYLEEIGHSSWI